MNSSGHLSADKAELFKDFLNYEQPRVSEQGFHTIKTTAGHVLEWFEKEGLAPEEAEINDILRYKKYVSDLTRRDGTPIAPGTMCNYLKAGKRLFNFLLLTERRATNPFAEIKYPRIPEHISRNILSEQQTGSLLQYLQNFTAGQTAKQRLVLYRSHVLAELLYATGLRIMEAAALLPADINIRQRLVTVQNGKGGKKRYAFLTGYAAEVLQHYLETGREKTASLTQKHTATLFHTGYTTLEAALNKDLKQACSNLGFPVITCHGFRHSLGTHLLRAGCDLRYIQIILGHEKLSSTQIYTRINKDDLKRSLDDFHPRQWNTRGGPHE